MKLIAIAPLFFGLVVGLMVKETIGDRKPFSDLITGSAAPLFLVVVSVFLILTLIVFLIRPERWGVTRAQLRLLWLLAFLLGAIGGPLVYEIANRGV